MENSTRLLAFISAQHSLLINKGLQTERLTAELKRIEKSNPCYQVAVLVKTALKMLTMGESIGMTMADMLEKALHKTRENQEQEREQKQKQEQEQEAHRQELITVCTVVFMQTLMQSIINRSNENLAVAQLKTMAMESSHSPELDSIAENMKMLRGLTLRYAQDLLGQDQAIARQCDSKLKYGEVQNFYEARTNNEILALLAAFAKQEMSQALSLIDVAVNSLPAKNEPFESSANLYKARIECLTSYAVTAAAMAKFVTDMLAEAIAAIGTVTVDVAFSRTSELTPKEIYTGLAALTSKKFNVHLN